MSTRTGPRKVVVHRTLPARPERVFAAWLDPEGMREWMAPSGTATVTLDGRVGGRFHIVMWSAGQAIAHTGEYLAIEPPSRLVFTWESPYTGRGRTVVTVLLERQGTDTALTLTHEGLPDEHVDPHQDGWTSIVSRLEGRLARSESPPGASGWSIDVAVAATIARPREDVARYAMDPGHEPRWISGIESSRPLTTPDRFMGMRVARVARFVGRRVNYILEVVEYEPDRRMVMHSVQSPFPMEITYEFEDIPEGGTRARIRVRGGQGLMFRFAGPVLAAVVRRNLTEDLRRLKGILESRL